MPVQKEQVDGEEREQHEQGVEIMGVRFAPFSLPMQRRLQTAAVCLTICTGPCLLVVDLLVIVYGPWWARYLMLLYLSWMLLIDRKTPLRGGRMIRAYQRSTIWKYFAQYFPARVFIQGKKPNPEKPHIIACHPHGILGISHVLTFAMDPFNVREQLNLDYRLMTVSMNFLLPIWRDFLMALGFIDASRESADYLLSRGKSVAVVVGGAREALKSRPKSMNLTLNSRKGFIRLAIRHGASVIPAISFGENDVYQTLHGAGLLAKLQSKMINLFGFTFPVAYGRGSPLDIPKQEDPTKKEIEKWHKKYMQILHDLYEQNRRKFGADYPLESDAQDCDKNLSEHPASSPLHDAKKQ